MATITEIESPKYAFKLKAGSHYDNVHKVSIEVGDVFHTNVDMNKLHGPGRWELIDGSEKESISDLKARIKLLEGRLPVEDPDDLDSKSIKQLRAYAAKMEPPVDLDTCNGKDEIVNAIRQAIDAA